MTNITQTPEKNKLKIKVPVVQSADHEIEIDLPYYLNRNDWFIKIVSRSKLIRVSVADYEGGYNSISFFEPGSVSGLMEAIEIIGGNGQTGAK